VSSTETIKRAVVLTLKVEILTASASASIPDPSMGKECLQSDLDTAVGADASSLDPKVAKIMSKAVLATWEMHRLQEILHTSSRVPSYSQ
jgi:hypothetical protein